CSVELALVRARGPRRICDVSEWTTVRKLDVYVSVLPTRAALRRRHADDAPSRARDVRTRPLRPADARVRRHRTSFSKERTARSPSPPPHPLSGRRDRETPSHRKTRRG